MLSVAGELKRLERGREVAFELQTVGIILAVGAGLIWPVVEQYDPDNVKVLYLCVAAVLVGFGLMAAVAHG